MPVSAARPLDWGFYVENGEIYFREKEHLPEEAELLAAIKNARALRGAHNAQNAAFAAAAAWECGLEDEEIAAGIASFPAFRIAWKRLAASSARSSSTTRKRPTPMRRKRRWRAFPISTGSSAARRRKAASSRCVRSSRASPKPISSARRPRNSPKPLKATSPSSAAARSPSRRTGRRPTGTRAILSCCSRRLARPTTSSLTSKRAARPFAKSFKESPLSIPQGDAS